MAMVPEPLVKPLGGGMPTGPAQGPTGPTGPPTIPQGPLQPPGGGMQHNPPPAPLQHPFSPIGRQADPYMGPGRSAHGPQEPYGYQGWRHR